MHITGICINADGDHLGGSLAQFEIDSLTQRIPRGDGDVHLPPGWGAIPQVEALKQLPNYEGYYVLELRPRFHEHLAAAVETARQTIDQAAG